MGFITQKQSFVLRDNFVIGVLSGNVGDIYVGHYNSPIERSKTGHLRTIIRGSVSYTVPGGVTNFPATQTVGNCSDELPDILVPGEYVMVATEDFEAWCIERIRADDTRSRADFGYNKLNTLYGQQIVIKAGQRVLMGTGEYRVGRRVLKVPGVMRARSENYVIDVNLGGFLIVFWPVGD